MESKAVIQFAELIRQRWVGVDAETQVWLGDMEQVRHGALPALVLGEVCPMCLRQQPHVLSFLGNWNQYTCLACGHRYSEQLVRAGSGDPRPTKEHR
jgi:hypothetical protein